jgi:hypothetical protein
MFSLLLCFHLVFCSFVRSQDSASSVHESARAERKTLEIKNIRLVAWQAADKKRKRVEVNEFRETKPQHLIPSDKFDVEYITRSWAARTRASKGNAATTMDVYTHPVSESERDAVAKLGKVLFPDVPDLHQNAAGSETGRMLTQ